MINEIERQVADVVLCEMSCDMEGGGREMKWNVFCWTAYSLLHVVVAVVRLFANIFHKQGTWNSECIMQ